MKIGLLAVALLSVAGSAQAGPLQYSFTGTVGRGTLDRGDGVLIDLAGHAVIITGITGDPLRPDFVSYWRATSTYDFGDLGSLTAPDMYVQTSTSIGLRIQAPSGQPLLDYSGFEITLAPIADFTPGVLRPLGTVRPLATRSNTIVDPKRTLSDGVQTLQMWSDLAPAYRLVITSATVTDTPEPAALFLIGLGSVWLGLSRPRKSSAIAARRDPSRCYETA